MSVSICLFRMNENFMGDIPALDVKTRHLKSITSARWGVLPLAFYQADGDIRYEKLFEIHALPVEPMEGLRPGMSVLVNLDELNDRRIAMLF